MKPILCYGGSFNPIHIGHLLCAQAAAEAAGFEQILLIPSAQPPHRAAERDMAAAEDRLSMCRLAVAGLSLFQVSEVELQRDGPSFTVDTVRTLLKQCEAEVHWLIGSDTLPRLPSWHDFDLLRKLVHFVVMGRPGCQIGSSADDITLKQVRHSVVQGPLIEISASAIRQRVKEGKDIRFYTPAEVGAYIAERGLYK